VKLKLFAPAKINLGLAVTGKLENGYHTLDTIFTTLNTGDVLILEPQESGITLEIVGSSLPTNAENLVYLAAERYLELAGIKTGVSLVLEKNLPIAAGLGGGSSDAAATLRGLSRIYPANIDLPALAKSLGADVPFLLEAVSGHFTAARAQWIGAFAAGESRCWHHGERGVHRLARKVRSSARGCSDHQITRAKSGPTVPQ
jgi:4-diphosphocytidyl-2C-methyl-D-erythritol kinase